MGMKIKMYPVLIKLNPMAKKILDHVWFDYEISVEFSNEELRRFSNNFIVVSGIRGYEVVLLDIRYRKSDKDKIVEFIGAVEEFYNIVYRDLDKYRPDSKELFEYIRYKYIGYEVVREELEKWFNDYIIKYGKIPSNNEIKEFLIGYMSSYDLKSEIEDIFKRAKLVKIK